ncbi:hypothetical protein FLSI110296_08855 [Flavobacterium sinopsychrotolerans]
MFFDAKGFPASIILEILIVVVGKTIRLQRIKGDRRFSEAK